MGTIKRVLTGGNLERKKDTWDAFEAQIRKKKGLHSIENYELIQYLKTKECKTLMEDNEITIHVATDYILLDENFLPISRAPNER